MRTFPLAVAIMLLGGCASVVPVPVSDVRPFRPITTSCRDTSETRRQVLAHNSVLDSLKSGRQVVYGDDCPLPSKKEAPKTS